MCLNFKTLDDILTLCEKQPQIITIRQKVEPFFAWKSSSITQIARLFLYERVFVCLNEHSQRLAYFMEKVIVNRESLT